MIVRKNGRDGVIKEKNATKERPIFTAAGSQLLLMETHGYRVRKYDPEISRVGVMV